MRRNIVVLRTSMKLAAAMLAGGLAVSACGTVQMGAAAITGNSRISSSTLTSQVADLSAAYQTDQAKGIKPQRPTALETQQVLTWLILFRVYDKMAAQQGVSVTTRQSQLALQPFALQASQSHVTLVEYLSAGAALPPDLSSDFGQAVAIQTVLVNRITGGKSPTTSAGQAAVSSQLGHYQCQAAKSLGIKVNPQYGEFNYNGYTVVPAPSTLAADPTPSPSASPALLTPPC
jgi:hypothetical protein